MLYILLSKDIENDSCTPCARKLPYRPTRVKSVCQSDTEQRCVRQTIRATVYIRLLRRKKGDFS